MRKYFYLLMTDQTHDPFSLIFKVFLKGCSLLYSLVVKIMVAGYEKGIFKRYDLGRPVISVGNITWGGVGKTPLVLWIAAYLRKKNLHPVILTRGYMAQAGARSDEVAMMRAALPEVPVVTNKDRVKGARYALLNHTVDVFLLDDGFQQWRVNKDLDIVAIDATNPFGNGSLLPRGILREPLRALSRADVFVVTKCDLGNDNVQQIAERLQGMKANAPVMETVHQPVGFESLSGRKKVATDAFKGKDVAILSSIGDPLGFENTVISLGVQVKARFIFSDHFRYDAVHIARLLNHCQQAKVDTLLTTAKDEIKLKSFLEWPKGLEVYVLKIDLHFLKGQDGFSRRVDSLLLR